LSRRTCAFIKQGGERCRQSPLQDEDFCFWHSPEHEKEAAEARRLGGLRRRREKTVEGAFGIEGIETVGGIRRVLEVAIIDALGLENSLNRSRVLIAAAAAAGRLLEAAELAERVAALESALEPRLLAQAPRRNR
jgi:hypothetical protein